MPARAARTRTRTLTAPGAGGDAGTQSAAVTGRGRSAAGQPRGGGGGPPPGLGKDPGLRPLGAPHVGRRPGAGSAPGGAGARGRALSSSAPCLRRSPATPRLKLGAPRAPGESGSPLRGTRGACDSPPGIPPGGGVRLELDPAGRPDGKVGLPRAVSASQETAATAPRPPKLSHCPPGPAGLPDSLMVSPGRQAAGPSPSSGSHERPVSAVGGRRSITQAVQDARKDQTRGTLTTFGRCCGLGRACRRVRPRLAPGATCGLHAYSSVFLLFLFFQHSELPGQLREARAGLRGRRSLEHRCPPAHTPSPGARS